MEKLKSLWIDCPFSEGIKIDDFLVAIGEKKSNSVYHVADVKTKDSPKPRMKRHHLKVYKSDIITALKRDENQDLIPFYWYKRK